VSLLLDRGANIHAEDDEAIRNASRAGHPRMVSLLLNRGADPRAVDDHALRTAAEVGRSGGLFLTSVRDAHIYGANEHLDVARLRAQDMQGLAFEMKHFFHDHTSTDAGSIKGKILCAWEELVDTFWPGGADVTMEDVMTKPPGLLARLQELASCSTIFEIYAFFRSAKRFTARERVYLNSPLLNEIYDLVLPEEVRGDPDIRQRLAGAILKACITGSHRFLRFVHTWRVAVQV